MIGNLNGVDMASRDQANRILLRRKISQTDAEVQTLRAKLKEQKRSQRFRKTHRILRIA